MFGDLFKKENKDAVINQELRARLAEKATKLAAEFLPAGAYLDGKQLPANHKPKRILPVIEATNEPATTVSKPAPSKNRKRKAQRQNAAAQPKSCQQAI
jgi:hypothetical protein